MSIINFKEIVQKKSPETAKKIPGFIFSILEKWLCVADINELLMKYDDKEGVDFVRGALLGTFHSKVTIQGGVNIPKEGRIIIVANHPLGGLDGLALIHASAIYRENIVFPVNDFLTFIPNLKSLFIPINKVGSNSNNIKTLEDTFASDKVILYFPAGLCSRKIKGKIVDLEWKKTVIKEAVKNQRYIIPTYIEGRNSNAFYRLANIRKFLKIKFNIEMSMLPREVFKKKDKNINITFGKPISWECFDSTKDPKQWANCLKTFVYTLKDNPNNIFSK